MKKLTYAFALGIMILFLVIGLFFSLILVHEESHKQDYRELVFNDKVCALIVPDSFKTFLKGNLGVYTYQELPGNETAKQFDEVTRYTEFKAYSINYLLMAVFVICALILVIPKLDSLNVLKREIGYTSQEDGENYETYLPI